MLTFSGLGTTMKRGLNAPSVQSAEFTSYGMRSGPGSSAFTPTKQPVSDKRAGIPSEKSAKQVCTSGRGNSAGPLGPSLPHAIERSSAMHPQ